MRSSRGTLTDMLRRKARQMPALQKLIDMVPTLDAAAIGRLGVEKWIKDALLALKQGAIAAVENAKVTEWVEQHVQVKTLSSVDGEIRRWTGGRQFIALDRGNMIEIDSNKLVWLPVSGGMWIETIFTRKVPADLLANSVHHAVGKRADYMQMYRDQINGAVHGNLPVIDMTGKPNSQTKNSVLNAHGVRITRL